MFLNKLFHKDTTEGAGDQEELLKLTMTDMELATKIDADIHSATELYQSMKTIQDSNEQYYLGSQLDKKRFNWELPTAENLLYMVTETMISIITGKRKEPIVMPARGNDESRELAQKTQQFLAWKWNDQDMKIKFEDWVRQAILSRIGVFKLRFDINRDDFEIQNLRPQQVMIDPEATDEYNARFIIEYRKDTLGDLNEMFPEAKGKLKKAFGTKLGTQITYVEYWTNEYVVWKVDKIILSKKKNPNWNWDEDDRKGSLKKLKKRWIEKTKNEKLDNILLNFFNEPRKPYVIVSLKNLGKDIYADTSDFEQGKVIQDIINRRKRQIDKAAVKGMGREVISGSVLTKSEAKKLMANPNAPLWLKDGKASDAVTHISPPPMSPIIFDDLQESKQALDNVMGIHGGSRGERGPQETATGRTILKEGDLGRVELSVRRLDKKLELLYGWMLQMTKVFYTDQHYVKILGGEGATQYLNYSGDDIEDGQEVIVKTEFTVDKATQRENALQRLQAGLSDPLTMYEDLDTPNPKERARRLVIYNVDPKLYVQTFCFDKNAEGAENTPEGKAEEEQDKIMAGEQVPPYPKADKAHLEAHGKFIQSGDFTQLEDVEIQQNMQSHVQGEIEILKGLRI